MTGVEPASMTWEAMALPLGDIRTANSTQLVEFAFRNQIGVPGGTRTHVQASRVPYPWPLDDRDKKGISVVKVQNKKGARPMLGHCAFHVGK